GAVASVPRRGLEPLPASFDVHADDAAIDTGRPGEHLDFAGFPGRFGTEAVVDIHQRDPRRPQHADRIGEHERVGPPRAADDERRVRRTDGGQKTAHLIVYHLLYSPDGHELP